jgi:glycosidase
MDPDRLEYAKERLAAAVALLFCFPGCPTVYYGDEAGMEGFEDPFNRRTYPWGHEDQSLIKWYSQLGALRKKSKALRKGDIHYLPSNHSVLAFTRTFEDDKMLCIFNAGDKPVRQPIPGLELPELLLGHADCYKMPRGLSVNMPSRSAAIFKMKP